MTDYFIDASLAINGSGIEASPYNSLAELDALTGDQSNDRWLIKRGGSIRSSITFSNADAVLNLFIGSYGVGEKPIINGSDIMTDWVIEDDKWYRTDTKIRGVWVNDVEQVAVSTKGAMVENSLWWDSPNNRLYIQPGINPNQATTEVTQREVIFINSTSVVGSVNIHLNNIHCTKSDSAGCKFFGGCQDSSIQYCKFTKNGSWDSTSNTGLSVFGISNVTLSTGVVIRGVESNNNQNNLTELQRLDAAVIEDCLGDGNGMGYELWGYVQNSSFRRNRATNSRQRGTFSAFGSGIWLTNSAQSAGETGNNTGNTFEYMECIGVSQYGLSLDAGVSNNFYNCLFVSDTTSSFNCVRVREPGAETNANTFTNCIFLITNSVSVMPTANFDSGSGTTVLKNYYHTTASITSRVKWEDGTTYSTATEAAYKVASGETGAFADPEIVNASIDGTLESTSPCIGAGNDLSLPVDVVKFPVNPTPDIGTRQYHGVLQLGVANIL